MLRGRYLEKPELLDILEAVFLGDIVDHDDGMRPFVVGSRDGAKPLLPSRIPDLQLDDIPVDSDRSA